MHDIAGPLRLTQRTLVACALIVGLGSCAALGGARDADTPATAGDDENLSRAHRVFLYQSRIANEVLDRFPLFDVLEDADPALRAAEAKMTDSCSPLAQAVLARFEGEEPSLGLRLRVMTSINACERAARDMDDLLNNVTIADSI